ncbi:MAG: hypothetical protein DSM107014_15255 [Gomphosphaeria aponina SAG 52.96 = DSM 107014]|uniref:Uncharacterized protein n=1 Tax=Gomphosphaeria aponina SAG 52.96 = DSM 107014 TaxID=1521640 RepID=A0A941GTT8_9CHRO|nr:hypothetical protein [Gomphosphaeria aponina SAG 52.96 = DSM 107014]
MEEVIIIVNADIKEGGKISPAAPVTEKMVTALIRGMGNVGVGERKKITKPAKVKVVGAADLWAGKIQIENKENNLICPLTIKLPDWIEFGAKTIYQKCDEIEKRRSWVEQKLDYKTSIGDSWLGDMWLPVVLTAKGPLYGEVIGEGALPNCYRQPIDLTDDVRQRLYYLAYNLLQELEALPAVYLLQFSLVEKEIVFDRLWPFPASPALASINIQQPDLFTCHWYCLTNQPILDLIIR